MVSKLDSKFFKQKAGDPHWYDIVVESYTTEIPIQITNFLNFIDLLPDEAKFDQIIETKAGLVYEVVTLKGCIDFFNEKSKEIKEQILQNAYRQDLMGRY